MWYPWIAVPYFLVISGNLYIIKNDDSHVVDFQGKINFFDLLSAEKLIFRGAHHYTFSEPDDGLETPLYLSKSGYKADIWKTGYMNVLIRPYPSRGRATIRVSRRKWKYRKESE
jgi:hypothetical protein